MLRPNQFVAHMTEHIAWRLGVEIELVWENSDWRGLGEALGQEIAKFPAQRSRSVALGMIDEGCAEISINTNRQRLKIDSLKNINLDWFLSSRCEQLTSGKPLIDLATGLAAGIGARNEVKICSFEDPHHTWEAVFRGVGIALK